MPPVLERNVIKNLLFIAGHFNNKKAFQWKAFFIAKQKEGEKTMHKNVNAKKVLSIIIIVTLIFTMMPISRLPVYAEDTVTSPWNPNLEEPALVVTGDKLVTEGAISADDLTSGIANEKSYTYDQLGALETKEVLYSAINTTPTKSIFLGKGTSVEKLLEASKYTAEKFNNDNINFVAKDGYTVVFDPSFKEPSTTKGKPLRTPSLGTSRYYYPNLASDSEADKVVVPTILAWEQGGTRGVTTIPTTTAALSTTDKLLLMTGQQNVSEQNNPLFNKTVTKIVVGNNLPSILKMGSQNYTRSDLLLMPRTTESYTYPTQSGNKTEYARGIPLVELLKGYHDADTVKFVTTDAYDNAPITVGELRAEANQYLLAYEKGASANALSGIYDSGKSDPKIKGYLTVYRQGKSPIKMVCELQVTVNTGTDFSNSPYKHITYSGAPYKIDAITGATLTVEGPGVKGSSPLSVSEIENQSAGAFRGNYTDERNGVSTTRTYEGIRLKYILNNMQSGATGVILTDGAKSVKIKNRVRDTIAEFTMDQINEAESKGKPIIVSYGTGDGTTISPFVFDNGAGANASLGNEDGCIKLVYDKSVITSDVNIDYTKFGNMAYIYVEEDVAPGYKHDKSPYLSPESAWYTVTLTGDKLGREVNYKVSDLEKMVQYNSDGKPTTGGIGYRNEYSLSNSTYWYVNEYEGIDLWKLLLKAGLPASSALDANKDSKVTFTAKDGYRDFDSFSLEQIANPSKFGFYEKNPLDNNDGTYVSSPTDLKRTGFPVLVSYGVNGYPYVADKSLPGFKSGLANDGGPLRIISGKVNYSHANGSKQAKLLDKIIVGNEVNYSTHSGNPNTDYQALGGQAINIKVVGADGNTIKTQNYTIKQLEDMIYGESVTKQERDKSKIKDFYGFQKGTSVYTDLYEGVSLEYLIKDKIQVPGSKGTITFKTNDMTQSPITLSLEDVFKSGTNAESKKTGLKSLIAFAKNGYPMVASSNDAGYIASFNDGFDGSKVSVENDGGPLALILPQTNEQVSANQVTSLKDITNIEINLQADKYAHIDTPYSDLAENTLTVSGPGTKLLDSKIFKVNELEGKQTLAITGDYNIKSSSQNSQIRYRGLDLYEFLKSVDIGLKVNATEIVVGCSDGSQMTFPMAEVMKKDYINGVTSTGGLKMMLAYGSSDVTKLNIEDGKPLVKQKGDSGYDESYYNYGGPLKLVVGQLNANDMNSSKILKDVTSITVNASELTSWKHDVNPTYEQYLDTNSYNLRVLNTAGQELTSKTYTLRQLEAMNSLIVRDDYTWIGTHENEGLDLWRFIQQEAGSISGITNPITVKVASSDGFSKELISAFSLDELKNGIKNGTERKAIIMAYADNGYPLVPNTASVGYTSGNGDGPLRLITQNNQGACLKDIRTIEVVVGNNTTTPDFTVSGGALSPLNGYTLDDIKTMTPSSIEYSWYDSKVAMGSVTDHAKGVLLKDILAKNGISSDRYTITLKTSDNYNGKGTYLDIPFSKIIQQNYLLAYEANGTTVSALDLNQKFRVYRNYNAGTAETDSWLNKCSNIIGIEVKDTLTNQTVYSIYVDGVATKGFKFSELKAMTPTTNTYLLKGGSTISVKGVLLSELLKSMGITDDNTKINIKTTDNYQDKVNDNALTYWNITLAKAKTQKYLIAYEANGISIEDKDKSTPIQTSYVRLYRDCTTDTTSWLNELKNADKIDVTPNYSFTSYKGTGKAGELPVAGVRSITLDGKGGTWVGTYGKGVAYKPSGSQIWTVYNTSNSALKSDYVVDVAVDKKGGVWFTQSATYNPADAHLNSGVAYAADPSNMNSLKFYDTSVAGTIPNNYVQQVEVDKEGVVWFGSFGGLTKYNPSLNTWKTWKKADGLPAESVDNFTLDQKGGIWIGCYPDGPTTAPYHFTGGYAYINSQGVIKTYVPSEEGVNNELLADFWVRDIAVDSKGGTWVVRSGSYSTMANVGGRVDYIAPDGTVTHYTGKQLLPEKLTNNSEIRTVAVDGKGGIWFGTWNGIFHCSAPTKIVKQYSRQTFDWPNESSMDSIYSLTITSDGKVLVGSNGGYVERTFYDIIDNGSGTGGVIDNPTIPTSYDILIDGSDVNEIGFTIDDIKKMPGNITKTYESLNNYNTREKTQFTGVPVEILIDKAGLKSSAKSIKIISQDGYYRQFNLDSKALGVYSRDKDGNPMIIAWKEGSSDLKLVVGQPDSSYVNKPLWVDKIKNIRVGDNTVTPGSGSSSKYEPAAEIKEEIKVAANDKGEVSISADTMKSTQGNLKIEGKGDNPTVVFDASTTKQLFNVGGPITGTLKTASYDEVVKTLPESSKKEVKELIGDRPIVSLEIKVNGKAVTNFNGSVKVSIPYTLKSSEDKNAIVIYYIDKDGKPNLINNCNYDEKTKSIVFKTNHFSVFAVGYKMSQFNDTKEHWSKDYVTYLSSRNIINGVSDNSFAPNENITRAQFAKILASIANIDISKYNTPKFTDVQGFYSPYITWANEAGIVNGIGNGNFAPNQNITREQIALMISRYVSYSKLTLPKTGQKIKFIDDTNISTVAYDAVNELTTANIISGEKVANGVAFNPRGNAKRGEAAKMLSVLLQQIAQ